MVDIQADCILKYLLNVLHNKPLNLSLAFFSSIFRCASYCINIANILSSKATLLSSCNFRETSPG